MVQLQHVHDTDGDVLLERLARAAVDEAELARRRHAGPRQQLFDLGLGRTGERRARAAHPELRRGDAEV